MYQDLTIKCKLEMLPSRGNIKAHQLAIDEDGVLMQFGFDMKDEHPAIPQHLYFLDYDASINDGDWCIYHEEDLSMYVLYYDKNKDIDIRRCKKIIATTDTSLNLPQHSQPFIYIYIESYNKGEKIEYCMVLIDNRLTLEMEKGIDAPVNENFNKPMVNKNNHIREIVIKDSMMDAVDSLEERLQDASEQLQSGRDYLMQVDADKITVEDALEAFGFGRNGLKFH